MPPLSVMIKPVSGLCNMRCSYCFYSDEMKSRQTPIYEKMSIETLDKLVRRAFSYADSSVSFGFQGGEPTLAGADFYRELLALEKKYNSRRLPVSHALQTNGLTLSDDMLDVLNEGHFLVGLSVDGTKDIHDSRRKDAAGKPTFDRIMQTAQALQKRGIDFNILCVVDQAISHEPDNVFDALSKFQYLQFIPCMNPLDGSIQSWSLDPKEYSSFLSAIYKKYAAMLRENKLISVRTLDNYLAILLGQQPECCGFSGHCNISYLMESDGSVYPCDFYALDQWKIGNINTQSFFAFEKSHVLQEFINRSLPIAPACSACPYAFVCRGGCRREREKDGVIGINRLCEGLKMFFEENLSDMQLLASQIKSGAINPR